MLFKNCEIWHFCVHKIRPSSFTEMSQYPHILYPWPNPVFYGVSPVQKHVGNVASRTLLFNDADYTSDITY